MFKYRRPLKHLKTTHIYMCIHMYMYVYICIYAYRVTKNSRNFKFLATWLIFKQSCFIQKIVSVFVLHSLDFGDPGLQGLGTVICIFCLILVGLSPI
jgi:hypothetical protein